LARKASLRHSQIFAAIAVATLKALARLAIFSDSGSNFDRLDFARRFL
jgi:hypothetical protein